MKKIKLATETISKSELQILSKWIEKNPQLTMSKKTQEFEKKWSQWLGVKYSVFVNSGSSAILATFQTLKELKKILQDNDICDLQKSSKNLIFSEINNDFKIMIISNIPDTDEDNLGEPIVEKNGELFDKILNAANLSRSSVYITPIIPWRIPGNRDLSDEEKSICIPIIKKQIEIINPKILILLGSDPLKYLLDDDGMMKKRGKWLEYHQNKKIIVCLPILDPSFLIRRPEYKRETWNDILNLKEKIKELV